MKKNLYILILIISWSFGCGKKDNISSKNPEVTTPANDTSEPSTGNLFGVINPAGAAIDIIASILVNGQLATTTVKPDANGHFFFKDLPKGLGGLTYTPASGYSKDGIVISVTGGKDNNVGTITILQLPGSITGTINPAGAAVQVTLKSQVDPAKILTISADPKTGNFALKEVPVGNYILSCTGSSGYKNSADQIISISSEKETNAGVIQMATIVPGNIVGTISPVGSVASIKATYLGGQSLSYNAVPDSKGNFFIPNIIPGNYTVTFMLNSGSILFAPFGKVVRVMEAKETNMGTIVMTTTQPPYMFSAMVNGAPFKTNSAYGTFSTEQNLMTINAGAYTLSIAKFTSPGEYVCNSTSASGISYTVVYPTHPGLADGFITVLSSTTKSINGSGVIKITAIDQLEKTVSGTFECTLVGSAGPKVITDGVMIEVPFN